MKTTFNYLAQFEGKHEDGAIVEIDYFHDPAKEEYRLTIRHMWHSYSNIKVKFNAQIQDAIAETVSWQAQGYDMMPLH